ncbi:hypothetical protein L484_009549 [Morus notabilis]|uniref:Uncharacterized protein n=1 Tax=Morus notabilis TaxID=981085 RepID=W9SKD7_9ROSA|nr:hypothetical protein L484_009549 [Morus notabilis]
MGSCGGADMGSLKEDAVACGVPDDGGGERQCLCVGLWVFCLAMKILFKVSFLSENEKVGGFGAPSSARNSITAADGFKVPAAEERKMA